MSMSSEQRSRWVPYFTTLGELVSIWDRLEGGCSYLFMAITSAKQPGGIQQQQTVVFGTPTSTSTKFQMLRNALRYSAVQDDIKNETEKAINLAEKLSVKRNRIIHGNWVTTHYLNNDPENFAPPIRVAAIPDLVLRNDILRAHVNRSNVLQKERAKYLFTIDTIQKVIDEMVVAIDELYRLARLIHGEEGTREEG